MAELVGCVNLSHSPFYNFVPPRAPDDPGALFTREVATVRDLVARLAVDVVVVFGPDHFRNMFYDCMPSFCVGVERVTGVGDYGTPAGDLPTAPALGAHLIAHTREAGFDPALSLHMGVDHGIAQVYANLFPDLTTPIVPVMVNTSAPPLPSVRRCYEFGRAVGAAIRAADGDQRVLVAGSGGLSHWPPSTSASDPDVDPAFRAFLIDGRDRVAEMEPGRQAVVRNLGASADGRVNPEWDRRFLRALSDDPSLLADLRDPDIDEQAGNGGHEVRTWIAAVGAWGGPMTWTAYEPVPRWITGMGLATSPSPVTVEERTAV
jgi:2,3-dihydroxyphenylpropionate 1,2-dioxygenase